MSRAYRLIGVAIGLSLAAPAVAADRHEAAVRAGVQAIVDASNRGDVDGVMRTMSPEVVLIARGRPDARAAEVREGFARTLARRSMTWSAEVEEVRVAGPLAYALITWTLRPATPASTRVYRERDLEIWRREGDGWKLYRGLSFGVPPDDG